MKTFPEITQIGQPECHGALNIQVAGDHYKSMAIQPVQYIHANGIGYFEGNVIKYVTRHRAKNGAEDIRKAIHYLNLLLELEYSGKPSNAPI